MKKLRKYLNRRHCFHLEQLDTDDSKEEDEKKSDNHNVADRLDGNNQTLDDFLQTLRPVDGPERSEDTENTKNFEEPNAAATED